MPIYKKGEKVEVRRGWLSIISVDSHIEWKDIDGYFDATVNSFDEKNGVYKVQYKKVRSNLCYTGLMETVKEEELRPVPPKQKTSGAFKKGEKVDVLVDGGWWDGHVVNFDGGEEEERYEVCLDYNDGKSLWYPVYDVRRHLDWVDGVWKNISPPTTKEGKRREKEKKFFSRKEKKISNKKLISNQIIQNRVTIVVPMY